MKTIDRDKWIQKARREGSITSQDACIYVCCKPAQEFFEVNFPKILEVYSTQYIIDPGKMRNEINELIKKFEKIGYYYGEYLKHIPLIGAILYIFGNKNGYYLSQQNVAKMIADDNITVTMRKYIKLYRHWEAEHE